MSKSPATKQEGAKLQEADQQMKEGDKLASKTFTRWKPDWDGAAVLYEKAATNYRNAKAYEQAKAAFKKASNAQYQNNIIYTAAKHLESAANIAKDQKLLEEAAELYAKASHTYRENGSGSVAAENLSKAAKTIEPVSLEKSMEYLKQACELFELEDKEHYSGETFKTAISLFLRNKKYADTLELLANQARVFKKLNQPHDLHKNFLSRIVIYLYCDDFVAANNLYQEFVQEPGFSSSQENFVALELLDAYEQRNDEALKKVTNKQIFNFLDNQVTKIARAMTISDSLVPSATTSLSKPNIPSASALFASPASSSSSSTSTYAPAASVFASSSSPPTTTAPPAYNSTASTTTPSSPRLDSSSPRLDSTTSPSPPRSPPNPPPSAPSAEEDDDLL